MSDIFINSCEQQGKGKYKVCFDNGVECFLYKGEMKAYHIMEGESLSEASFQDLMTRTLGKRATKRAMHLLEQMDRSEAKLREKLMMNGYPRECIDQAIEYVKSYHYLDDYRLACSIVRYQSEKLSRQQLLQKLLIKGICKQDALAAIEEEYVGEELEQIKALLVKRKYSSELSDEGEKRRTYAFLARRGFKSSDILKAMKYEW